MSFFKSYIDWVVNPDDTNRFKREIGKCLIDFTLDEMRPVIKESFDLGWSDRHGNFLRTLSRVINALE